MTSRSRSGHCSLRLLACDSLKSRTEARPAELLHRLCFFVCHPTLLFLSAYYPASAAAAAYPRSACAAAIIHSRPWLLPQRGA